MMQSQHGELSQRIKKREKERHHAVESETFLSVVHQAACRRTMATDGEPLTRHGTTNVRPLGKHGAEKALGVFQKHTLARTTKLAPGVGEKDTYNAMSTRTDRKLETQIK